MAEEKKKPKKIMSQSERQIQALKKLHPEMFKTIKLRK